MLTDVNKPEAIIVATFIFLKSYVPNVVSDDVVDILSLYYTYVKQC